GRRLLHASYTTLGDQTRAVGEAWARWRGLARELETAETGQRELALERDRLAWQVGELDRLKLVPGEWQQLEDEQKRLAHAASLIEGARGAADALTDDDGALAGRLHQVLQRLRPLAAIDARLDE